MHRFKTGLLSTFALMGWVMLIAPASAEAVFEANASGVLSLDAPLPTDVTVTTDAFVFDDFTFEDGSASASTSGTALAGDQPLLDQSAVAGGSALPLTTGSFAQALFLTDGNVTFVNTGASAVDLALSLLWSVEASAGVTSPLEDAFGNAIVELFGAADFFRTASADSLLGVFQDADSGTFDFTLSLDPFETAELTLLVDADGAAFSVPGPGSLPIFAAALLGLAGLRTRRP